MTGASARRNGRQRGSIEELPSGALRVAVYAGKDPLTGRRHYLREVIPAGPSARAEAQKVLRRLATQVDDRRNPRTNATVDQLLERYRARWTGPVLPPRCCTTGSRKTSKTSSHRRSRPTPT